MIEEVDRMESTGDSCVSSRAAVRVLVRLCLLFYTSCAYSWTDCYAPYSRYLSALCSCDTFLTTLLRATLS